MNAKKLDGADSHKHVSNEVSPEAYQSPPWWYDIRGFFILTFAYRDTLWSQINFFNRNIGRIHLEAAIGTGTLSHYILKYRQITKQPDDFVFYGVDYSPAMLDGAKQRFKEKNVVIELGDLTSLKFKNETFHTINLANSFHTIKDIQLALNELNRVLKSEGTIAINALLYPGKKGILNTISNSVNAWGQRKGILYRPYEESEIQQIVENANFKVLFKMKKGNALYLKCKKN